jgi:hypothetical protein
MDIIAMASAQRRLFFLVIGNHLPSDWESRAREYTSPQTNGVVAIVPEPNDVALSKLCAWRPKDIEWLRAAAANMIIDLATMRARLPMMPERAGDLASLERRLSALAAPPPKAP